MAAIRIRRLSAELRDAEYVPFGEDIAAYFAREVQPHWPDAWINHDVTDAQDGLTGVVGTDGQSFELPGLYLADGSIFPTSIGVNSQLPIMTMATRIAWSLRDKLTSKAPRPAQAAG